MIIQGFTKQICDKKYQKFLSYLNTIVENSFQQTDALEKILSNNIQSKRKLLPSCSESGPISGESSQNLKKVIIIQEKRSLHRCNQAFLLTVEEGLVSPQDVYSLIQTNTNAVQLLECAIFREYPYSRAKAFFELTKSWYSDAWYFPINPRNVALDWFRMQEELSNICFHSVLPTLKEEETKSNLISWISDSEHKDRHPTEFFMSLLDSISLYQVHHVTRHDINDDGDDQFSVSYNCKFSLLLGEDPYEQIFSSGARFTCTNVWNWYHTNLQLSDVEFWLESHHGDEETSEETTYQLISIQCECAKLFPEDSFFELNSCSDISSIIWDKFGLAILSRIALPLGYELNNGYDSVSVEFPDWYDEQIVFEEMCSMLFSELDFEFREFSS